MAHHILVKLPAEYSFQDVQNFEVKAITNSGVELISNSEFEYVTVEHSSSLSVGKGDPEDHPRELMVSQVPRIELSA